MGLTSSLPAGIALPGTSTLASGAQDRERQAGKGRGRRGSVFLLLRWRVGPCG